MFKLAYFLSLNCMLEIFLKEGQSFYKDKCNWWANYQINDLVVFNNFKESDYQVPHRLKLLDCFRYVIESRGYVKFSSYISFVTSNYECTEPNKRRLDLDIIELGSDIRQIIKGYGYEWDKKYIEHIMGDLNAVTLHFSGDVHSDST